MKQLGFPNENCGDGIAVSLPNYDHNFSRAALVPRVTAITTMCFDIGGLDVPTKIPAILLAAISLAAFAP
jgi:hypothetical protein